MKYQLEKALCIAGLLEVAQMPILLMIRLAPYSDTPA